MQSAEVQMTIEGLRDRSIRGEVLTDQELMMAVKLMREERVSAGFAGAKAKEGRVANKKVPVDSDALMRELEGMGGEDGI